MIQLLASVAWLACSTTVSTAGPGEESVHATATKIQPSDGLPDDRFGAAVSIFGDRALIGARWVDVPSSNNAGAAYVFRRIGSTWLEEAQLRARPSDPVGDEFGTSVALGADLALVGAPGWSEPAPYAGAAFVYRREPGGWKLDQMLQSDAHKWLYFGTTVALDRTVCVVGAPKAYDNGPKSGAVYIFRKGPVRWNLEEKLIAFDNDSQDNFGSAVAIEGDVLLVGAEDQGPNVMLLGAAYVYRRIRGDWELEAKLTPPDLGSFSQFGRSVALCGDTALVGAWRDPAQGLGSGSAYLFRRVAGIWDVEAKLLPSNPPAKAQFGCSVSLAPDVALISSCVTDGPGAAHVFQRQGTTWTESAKLVPPDGSPPNAYGRSVSLHGEFLVVGDPYDSELGLRVGAAYLAPIARYLP